MLFLLRLKDHVNVGIDVVRGLNRHGQLKHRLAGNECLLVVVFDLYIDNMDDAIEFTPPGQQVIADSIKTPFLAGDHNIRHRLAVLPSFGGALDVPISVEHL